MLLLTVWNIEKSKQYLISANQVKIILCLFVCRVYNRTEYIQGMLQKSYNSILQVDMYVISSYEQIKGRDHFENKDSKSEFVCNHGQKKLELLWY